MAINQSMAAATLSAGQAIRIGFQFLHGITDTEAESIVIHRPKDGYKHPMEVVEHAGIRLEIALGLIQIGAFDQISTNRRQLLEDTRRENRLVLEGQNHLDEESPLEQVRNDYRWLGFGQHEQWLGVWRPKLVRQGYKSISEARRLPAGKMARVVGCLIRPHRPPTRSGRLVVFFSLLDETGLLEAHLNDRRYQQYGQWLFGAVNPVIEVIGRMEAQGISVHSIAPWTTA
jgi:error-prone DNA polymerase